MCGGIKRHIVQFQLETLAKILIKPENYLISSSLRGTRQISSLKDGHLFYTSRYWTGLEKSAELGSTIATKQQIKKFILGIKDTAVFFG